MSLKALSKKSGKSEKELEQLVVDKKEELKGLISNKGAIDIVERELGKTKTEPVVAKSEPKPQFIEGMDVDLITPIKTDAKPTASAPITKEEINFDDITYEIPKELPKPKTKEEITKKQEQLKPKTEEQKYELQVIDKQPDLIITEQQRPLTLEEKKQKILQTLELLEYAASHALNKDDFWLPPRSHGKKALTRMGCNKLAVIFGISTETVKVEVVKELNIKGKEDIVAYATVKATRPGGSYVIISAYKALSEYESDKPGAKDPHDWVDIQTLKGTAETRASNRAIQNAIGYVPKDYIVATKEELQKNEREETE